MVSCHERLRPVSGQRQAGSSQGTGYLPPPPVPSVTGNPCPARNFIARHRSFTWHLHSGRFRCMLRAFDN